MDWPTRCFTAMDSTVEEVLGYPQAYWQDLDCWARTIHEEDRARTLAFLEAQTAAGRNHQFEYREIDPEGQTRWVRQIVTVVSGVEGAERLVGFSQDITSIKRADETVRSSEAKLLQAQKMEAMGQLAGGVAHDFNNILVATMMQLGLLRHHPSLDAATQEELKELENETRRAAGLTRQLLLFSRRSAKEARVLDLNSLVENLLKMLRRLIGEHIELAFAPIATSPTVEADAGMLEQVVMNLAVNARDAMPRGGRLTLALELINLDERQAQAQPEARAGEFVCLRVTDTGCGMDDATLKRVFEPFFTTKPAGQGTGLGLATVYSIAQQHQGWVSVQSQLLKGTTFRVYLPKATQPVATPLPLAQVALPAGRHETILVVEDESVVRAHGSPRLALARLPGVGRRQWPGGGQALATTRHASGLAVLGHGHARRPHGAGTGPTLAQKETVVESHYFQRLQF